MGVRVKISVEFKLGLWKKKPPINSKKNCNLTYLTLNRVIDYKRDNVCGELGDERCRDFIVSVLEFSFVSIPCKNNTKRVWHVFLSVCVCL